MPIKTRVYQYTDCIGFLKQQRIGKSFNVQICQCENVQMLVAGSLNKTDA